MPAINLSIIIISYNTKQITLDCLQSIDKSLENSLFSTEVIVIDNNSTDGSHDAFGQFQPQNYRFKPTFNTENTGFGRANNQGAKIAQGEYIFFLNSDIIVLDKAITDLLGYFQQNEDKIHFLGGKLLNQDKTPQPSCGPFYTLPVVFGALFLKGDYWGLTRYSPIEPRKVDWVSGACILTKKAYFEQVGGFDEQIFMYMEEIDLLYRAAKQKMDTFIYPQAQFIHLGSASSGGKTYPIIQVYKGFLYFYNKHYTRPYVFLLKIMLQLKALVSIFLGILTGNSYLKKTYGEALKITQMA